MIRIWMRIVNAMIPKKVMAEVDMEIEKEYPESEYELGQCHEIWALKGAMLAQRGYKWYSPQDMFPGIRFD